MSFSWNHVSAQTVSNYMIPYHWQSNDENVKYWNQLYKPSESNSFQETH